MQYTKNQNREKDRIGAALEFLKTGEEVALASYGLSRWERITAKECKEFWRRHGKKITEQFAADFPGRRPAGWWEYAAPEPRKRLGGIGDPAFEHLAYKSGFHLGLPNMFLSKWDEAYYNGMAFDIHGQKIDSGYKPGDFAGRGVDPANPPKFESQAAYLERLGLLLPGEESRLTTADFQPETITPDAD